MNWAHINSHESSGHQMPSICVFACVKKEARQRKREEREAASAREREREKRVEREGVGTSRKESLSGLWL